MKQFLHQRLDHKGVIFRSAHKKEKYVLNKNVEREIFVNIKSLKRIINKNGKEVLRIS